LALQGVVPVEAMPRYFFDHHYEADIALDDEGVELADTSAAKKYALEALGKDHHGFSFWRT
jgi:Domain of unknown function (DUF6894)